MLSRRRRLLSHAALALGMALLSWLFLVSGFTGVTRLLSFGAAGASVLVGTGFAVRFLSVLLSEPDRSIPAESAPAARHWTENGLIAWTGLCIAALTAQAVTCAFDDPRRAVGALTILLLVGVLAMQAVRLVRAERGARGFWTSVS